MMLLDYFDLCVCVNVCMYLVLGDMCYCCNIFVCVYVSVLSIFVFFVCVHAFECQAQQRDMLMHLKWQEEALLARQEEAYQCLCISGALIRLLKL